MMNWRFLRLSSVLLFVFLCEVSSYRSSGSGGGVGGGLPDYNTQKLRLVYSWKALEFDYPSARARQNAINRGEFIFGAPVPIDVDVIRGRPDKVIVTIPRFQDGVPVTLGWVTDKKSAEGNPIIAPYPSWEWNTLGNCDHITSVYRVKVDECGRLWVLDTGKLKEEQICPPQLLAFNPYTGQVLSRYKFPLDQLAPGSLFITPAVDIRDPQGQCADTFVYIADVTGHQLLVYDHRNKRSWNIQNNLFYPYPPHGTFTIAGQSFDLMDGIFGLALSPLRPNEDRILYFHSLASVVESFVPTSVIRNFKTFEDNPEAMARSFKTFALSRPSQSAAQAMDRNGVMIFGLMSEIAIGCWHSYDYPEYGGSNLDIAVVNRETLQFASGLKISARSPQDVEEVWIMTSAFQKVMNGLNPNETNFRIQVGAVPEVVRGTKCDVHHHRITSPPVSGSGGRRDRVNTVVDETGSWGPNFVPFYKSRQQ